MLAGCERSKYVYINLVQIRSCILPG